MPVTTTPQVWIGCLAAYNEGHLHGKWVDATDADEMEEARAEIIKSSPALLPEEWYIGDYDGFGSVGRSLGEYADFEAVAKVGEAIEEYGEPLLKWLEATEYSLDEIDDLGEEFQNHYRGEWDSEKEYAYHYLENCGWGGLETIPDELLSYLDMDAIVRDLFQHGEYTFDDGYVFEDNV